MSDGSSGGCYHFWRFENPLDILGYSGHERLVTVSTLGDSDSPRGVPIGEIGQRPDEDGAMITFDDTIATYGSMYCGRRAERRWRCEARLSVGGVLYRPGGNTVTLHDGFRRWGQEYKISLVKIGLGEWVPKAVPRCVRGRALASDDRWSAQRANDGLQRGAAFLRKYLARDTALRVSWNKKNDSYFDAPRAMAFWMTDGARRPLFLWGEPPMDTLELCCRYLCLCSCRELL